MTHSNKIKISSGKYKGRMIELPLTDKTRSSKSIVRSSVIDTFQSELLDNAFVEVFAGSGSVGIEAISRGAAHGIFCEKDRVAYDYLQKNIKSLKIENATAFFQDSFGFFGNLKAFCHNLGLKAIFYFDPPFDIRDGMESIYEKTFKLIETLDKSQVICIAIEARTGSEMPQTIGNFTQEKIKKFGKTSIAYYR